MNSKWIFKLILTSLAVSFSSMVSSMDEDGKCCPTVQIGLIGGWFATNSSDTVFGIDSPDRTTPPTGEVLELNPKLKFSAGIDLKYQMPECCYHWAASYIWHRDKRDGGDFGINNVGITSAPARLGSVVDTYADAVVSHFRSHFDFADVEFGTTVCVLSDCFLINPRVGLSYARVRENQLTLYKGLNGLGPDSYQNVEMLSTYKGFGPSIGTDIHYLFCANFSLVGNIRYSALVGALDAEYNAASSVPQGVTNLNLGVNRQFVSLFQSDLGVAYAFDWCGICGSFKAGYFLTKAIDSVRKVSLPDDTLSGFIISRTINSGYHGPFIRLAIHFGV